MGKTYSKSPAFLTIFNLFSDPGPKSSVVQANLPRSFNTDLPQNKNKFMTHISGTFNGAKFRCVHMGYMRFPKRTKNVTDRFLSRFWVCFHFKSSKTARYWVFYDKIFVNLRVSFLFKLFLFIGKVVPAGLDLLRICIVFAKIPRTIMIPHIWPSLYDPSH